MTYTPISLKNTAGEITNLFKTDEGYYSTKADKYDTTGIPNNIYDTNIWSVNNNPTQSPTTTPTSTSGDTGFKYYKNNLGYYEVLPWLGNVPTGYTPISKEDFLANEAKLRAEDPNRWNAYFDQMKGKFGNAWTGGTSGYQMKDGIPWETSAIQKEEANKKAVQEGTMKQVLVNGQPAYVPTGSAADQNIQNPVNVNNQPQLQQTTQPQQQSMTSGYSGPSVVDYLTSIGQPSDFQSRANLAKQYGISNYSGTASQNTDLLGKLRGNVPSGGISSPASSAVSGVQNSQQTGTQGPTTSDDLFTQLGISVPQTTTQSPINSFADLYKQVYDSYGLGSIKSEYEKFTKEYSDLQNKKSDEALEINNNPWYTEGKRVSELRKLDAKYEARESNLLNRTKLLESMYESGRQDAQFVSGKMFDQIRSTQDFNEQLALKAIDIAEARAEAQAKLLEFNPSNFKEVNGGLFDVKNQQWIVPPKESGGGGGMTQAQLVTTVNQIAGAFDNEQTVKDYNTIKRSVEIYNNLGSTATDDIQRVYTFAKVADPNSAVKEGEYNSIEKYAQALLQRAGLKVKRVFSATGILTPEARTAMGNTLRTSLSSAQNAYNNVYNEYQRQINDAYSGTPRNITNYSNYAKGSLSDRDFVEYSLSRQGIKYNDVVKNVPSGYMRVVDNLTGQVGTIPVNEFNSSNYTSL